MVAYKPVAYKKISVIQIKLSFHSKIDENRNN